MRKLEVCLTLFFLFAGYLIPIYSMTPLDGYFDTYGKIAWRDEQIHLRNFEIYLLNNADMIGYIAFHWTSKAEFVEMKRRAIRAKNYFVRRKKLPAKRLVVVEGQLQWYPLTILQPVRKDFPRPNF